MTTELLPNAFAWYVGLDWGTTAHQVHVSDAAGTRLGERRVEHTAAGLESLVAWLMTLAAGHLERVAVAIEVPHGAVVALLLERGAAVFTLNPMQIDRFRDRFSPAGAKDDRRDAQVLGSALRTDQHCFRRLRADDPRLIQLRELGRAADELTEEYGRLTNRVREQVHRIAPEWLTLSPSATDPWFWALLALAESPVRARRLRRGPIAKLLQRHRIRRVTATDVLRVLQGPALVVAPGTVEATTQHLALLLPRLRLVQAQRDECGRALEALLTDLERPEPPAPGVDSAEPSDVAIVRSVPGIGRGVATTLVGEAMPLLRQRDYATLRALGGVAPVTRQSGKRLVVGMRYACNQRLRQAYYHWAFTSIRCDAGARAYYARLRARGHSHARALRSLADRWLRILVSMLTARTLYDPARIHRMPAGAPPSAAAL